MLWLSRKEVGDELALSAMGKGIEVVVFVIG